MHVRLVFNHCTKSTGFCFVLVFETGSQGWLSAYSVQSGLELLMSLPESVLSWPD